MKTVRQIMAETNALDNVELMKQMMAWPYEHKVRHAEEVARAFWQRNTEEGRNLHVSVGGLDSITLHYFLQEIGVLVPCISCSTLEQKGVQKVHHRIREEMEAEYAEWEHDHIPVSHFCQCCGRPLTDAAWGVLEKRLEVRR